MHEYDWTGRTRTFQVKATVLAGRVSIFQVPEKVWSVLFRVSHLALNAWLVLAWVFQVHETAGLRLRPAVFQPKEKSTGSLYIVCQPDEKDWSVRERVSQATEKVWSFLYSTLHRNLRGDVVKRPDVPQAARTATLARERVFQVQVAVRLVRVVTLASVFQAKEAVLLTW
jgi:hypothetical protein